MAISTVKPGGPGCGWNCARSIWRSRVGVGGNRRRATRWRSGPSGGGWPAPPPPRPRTRWNATRDWPNIPASRWGAGRDAVDAARTNLTDIAARPSYVRSFAYATGPAYGLLLDRGGGGAWRKAVRGNAALGALLAARIGSAAVPAVTERYGAGAIRTEEAIRAERIAERDRDYRTRLIDGPVLRIGFVAMNIEFDPNRVFALAGEGSVYPALTIRDAWGTLIVTGDALLASDWSNVRVGGPARRDGGRLAGPGWTLVLKPGWALDGLGREQRLVKRP